MILADSGKTGMAFAWAMLPARLLLFALVQGLFALVLGNWEASIAWWPLCATLVDLVTIGLLIALFRAEAGSYFALFRIDRSNIAPDLGLLLCVVLVGLPLAILPSIWLGSVLFGDAQLPLAMLVRPLPLWAVLLSVSFPLTIVLAELPAYFGYCAPRLAALTGRKWLATGLGATFLAAQHMTLPLIFDARFAVWRFLMFLPFALLLGAALRWRPSLLPFLVVVHGCMDAATLPVLLQRAT